MEQKEKNVSTKNPDLVPYINYAELEDIAELPNFIGKSKNKTLPTRELKPSEKNEQIRHRGVLVETVRSAIQGNTLLRGVITSVQPKKISGRLVACAVFDFEPGTLGMKVLLPFHRLFQTVPMLETKGTDEEKLNEEMHYLRQLIGAEVRYLPKTVIEDRSKDVFWVIGDRMAALAVERTYYYLRKNANIKIDKVYRARVVVVRPNQVLLCLGGFEKMLSLREMTNRYCPNAEDMYLPGQEVTVVVREIHIEDGKLVNVYFDPKAGEIAENYSTRKGITANEVTFATISKVIPYTDENDIARHRVIGWVDAWDLPVRFTHVPANRHGKPLEIGDRVLFRTVAIGDDGYIAGFIIRVISTGY